LAIHCQPLKNNKEQKAPDKAKLTTKNQQQLKTYHIHYDDFHPDKHFGNKQTLISSRGKYASTTF